MHILMLAKEKGGAGASTLAHELGVVAASEGQRVVFIDLDPQASLSKWWNRRTAGAVEQPNPGLAAPSPNQLVLDRLHDHNDADLVIIDVPPSVHSCLLSVMRAADFILVLSRPTGDDFDAPPTVVDMIDQSSKRYAFAVTQAPTGRRIRAVEEAIPILARQGRVVGVLRFRTAFPTAAAAEIRELWGFVGAELRQTRLAPTPAYA